MKASLFRIGPMICASLLLSSGSLTAQIADAPAKVRSNAPQRGVLRPETQVDWSKAREVTSEKKLQTDAGASKPMEAQLATMTRPLDEVRPGDGHSLYTKSIILWDGEMYTLVPVGSVLHLPANLRDRVIDKPQGDFTVWPNFLERNKTWLAGKEVPLKMARGDAELAAIALKETSGSRQLLVSVYRQCPITVLEPAPPEQAPAKP